MELKVYFSFFSFRKLEKDIHPLFLQWYRDSKGFGQAPDHKVSGSAVIWCSILFITIYRENDKDIVYVQLGRVFQPSILQDLMEGQALAILKKI